jgi:PHP family Zn ribbon phosphoesterase
VEELADRPAGFQLPGAIPAYHLVPLEEILVEYLGLQNPSRRTRQDYLRLVERGGSEFSILLDLTETELKGFMEPRLAEGILNARAGSISTRPGYDGVYGRIRVFPPDPSKAAVKDTADPTQLSFF